MKIGFALITASPFFEKVIKIENSIHEEAGFFDLLGKKKNLPHTTVFQGEMVDSFDYVAAAREIEKNLFVKELNFTEVRYVPEGWYFLMCEKTAAFEKLHNFTLELVKDSIVLNPDRLSRNINELSEEEIAGIRDYGYRYAGKAFCPHITLGRTNDKKDNIISELNAKFAFADKPVPVARITVYKMGNNGTHSETLYESKTEHRE